VFAIQLLSHLALLSKKLAVKMLRLYSAIYKAANEANDVIDDSLERLDVDDAVLRQYRNFNQSGMHGTIYTNSVMILV